MASFVTKLTEWISSVAKDSSPITILMIGGTGAGKSTLINNLLWQDVAEVGGGFESETSVITKHEGEVNGVPVVFYDTPGLGDSRSDSLDEQYLKEIKELMEKEDIVLVVFCFKMTENKMHQGLIRTIASYSSIGIDWNRCVIALTFADAIPVPSSVKKDPNFNMAEFFESRTSEWKKRIQLELEKVGLREKEIKIRPTAGDRDETLPNEKEWFFSFWMDVIQALPAPVMMRFLKIHENNIKYKEESIERSSDVVAMLESVSLDEQPPAGAQCTETPKSQEDDQASASPAVTVTTSVSPTISVGGNTTKVIQQNVQSDTASSNALTMDREQRETFENVVGEKVAQAADIAHGGMVGAGATTLGTAAIVAAGVASAPIMLPAAAVGAAVGAVTKWLGWW